MRQSVSLLGIERTKQGNKQCVELNGRVWTDDNFQCDHAEHETARPLYYRNISLLILNFL